jgi:hypothetical protein
MSRIKNPQLFEIALHTGGSHYPDVGGELLEKYGEAIVRKCAEIAQREDHDPSECILSHFGFK